MTTPTEGYDATLTGERPGPGRLPSGLRLLCIRPQEPSWTGLTLQLDRLGSSEPRFRWSPSQAAAAALLHEEAFDVVILGEPGPADTDPLIFAEALRGAGCEDPVLLLSPRSDDAWLLRCSELDVELLPAANGWDSRALAPWIARAITRRQMVRDHQRMRLAERRLQQQDRDRLDETVRQLRQIADRAAGATSGRGVDLAPLRARYGELLRAAALVGCERLDEPLRQLVVQLADAEAVPDDVLRLHADGLQDVLAGLGNRSVRHVQSQADLLAIDVLVRFGAAIQSPVRARRRYVEHLDHGLNLLDAQVPGPRPPAGA